MDRHREPRGQVGDCRGDYEDRWGTLRAPPRAGPPPPPAGPHSWGYPAPKPAPLAARTCTCQCAGAWPVQGPWRGWPMARAVPAGCKGMEHRAVLPPCSSSCVCSCMGLSPCPGWALGRSPPPRTSFPPPLLPKSMCEENFVYWCVICARTGLLPHAGAEVRRGWRVIHVLCCRACAAVCVQGVPQLGDHLPAASTED